MALSTRTNKERFWDGIAKVFKEQQVDVLLKARGSHDGEAISAHKLLLSARSEVFKKMFESDEGKASPELEIITLVDLKKEALEAFVEFMYSDGSKLSWNAKQHARSLYRAADKYEIPHLRDLCRDVLRKTLTPSSALNVLPLAEIPFDKSLSDAALRVITDNIETISHSTELEPFVVQHPNLAVRIIRALSMIRRVS